MSNIVKEQFLDFKDTFIYQNKSSFNFNLDSVLLANFINISVNKKIMDLATGNIPIPLILAKKNKVKVDCIELQKEVYDLGIKTIECNNLSELINLYNMDIKDVNKIFKINSYDIVSINPPYFTQQKENKNISKSIARHEISITLDEILKKVNYLLNNGGHFYMIHRVDRFIEIIDKLKDSNLEPKRISYVYPSINSKSKLFMVECIKNGNKGLIVDKPVIIYDCDGNYTKNVLEMFGDCDVTKEL